MTASTVLPLRISRPASARAWHRVVAAVLALTVGGMSGLSGNMAQAQTPAPATRTGQAGGSAPAGATKPWNFEALGAIAAERARQPWQAPSQQPPAELKALNYDQYRDIRFKPERALWHDQKLPFELMFFHLGKFQTDPVRINEVTPQGIKPLQFNAADFDYGKNKLHPQRWGNIGFAGFRAHYALNNAAYKDELVVFLGASYFRALGAGQHYGLSARGLAINTVGGQGEEFPRFSEFWIDKPAPGAKQLRIYALLESPRVTGAYRFDITPGQQTAMQVQARVFLRQGATPPATLGVAPLTSMYQFGENQPHRDDFRPEVHDSDGLLVASGNGQGQTEWLWRPLQNPARPLVTSMTSAAVKGFGLMQRDRRFASYEDSEAQYERRPSAWVTPLGDWGPGRVELLQLPTPDETNDNVVAYWVPAQGLQAGKPLDLAWRVDWQGDADQRPPGAWVAQTRTGRSFAPLAPDQRQFIIDFQGPALKALPPSAKPEAVVTVDANAVVEESPLWRLDATGDWRLALRLKVRDPAKPVELRAYVRHGHNALSETWTYIIPPKP